MEPLADPFVLHLLHNLRPHNPLLGGLDHKDSVVLPGRCGGDEGVGRIADCKGLLQIIPGRLGQSFHPLCPGQLLQKQVLNDWQLRGCNMSNPTLVMKYLKNCGDTFDWFISLASEENKKQLRLLQPLPHQLQGRAGRPEVLERHRTVPRHLL